MIDIKEAVELAKEVIHLHGKNRFCVSNVEIDLAQALLEVVRENEQLSARTQELEKLYDEMAWDLVNREARIAIDADQIKQLQAQDAIKTQALQDIQAGYQCDSSWCSCTPFKVKAEQALSKTKSVGEVMK